MNVKNDLVEKFEAQVIINSKQFIYNDNKLFFIWFYSLSNIFGTLFTSKF